MPAGHEPRALAGRFHATPEGDRRCGVDHGVTGPLSVEVLGAQRELECASFRWWSEERTTSSDGKRTMTNHTKRHTIVSIVRLPARVPTPIALRRESAFGMFGLTRGGQQVESTAFNRLFRVESRDQRLTLQLLDATVQERLATAFGARTIELADDLLVLGGEPAERDRSLYDVIGFLPVVREETVRLLELVPAQFWRALGVTRPDDESGGDSDADDEVQRGTDDGAAGTIGSVLPHLPPPSRGD